MKKTKIKILKAVNGEYYWAAFAKNGKEIGKSSETYKNRGGVLKSIRIMKSMFFNVEKVSVIDTTSPSTTYYL